MELLLIRHGKAEAHGHPGGDGARALLEKGRAQARKVGSFLARQDLLPELVLTGPLVRARETATGVCEAAGIAPPVVEPWLSCGMRPEEALQELAAYQGNCRRVAMVGHEPDFSELVEKLLGTASSVIQVKKASIILLSVHPPRNGGLLHFSIWPTFL